MESVEFDPIVIRGAREHNLKNISLEIPSQKFVVITGPSGSGKSSLAFDTVFAEGHRRYIESLSAYARQFLEQLSKPDLDFIDGLSPAIAIEQKTITNNPRSTVGTVTEIYDFVRLLYSRVGVVRDPETGELLKAHSDQEIVQLVRKTSSVQTKVQLFASVVRGKKGEYLREFEQWRRAGFTKVRIDGKIHDLHDPILISRHQHHDIDLLIDTILPAKTETEQRVLEALKICDRISGGWLRCLNLETGDERLFSRKIASTITGQSFPDLEPRLFSFNSPYGMCQKCKGLGYVDKTKNPRRSAKKTGSEDDNDESAFDLEDLDLCPACQGKRLRAEAGAVQFAGIDIHDFVGKSAEELLTWLENLEQGIAEHPVTRRLIEEISIRLKFLVGVGVGYLTLDRRAGTLSGGEAQRIRLATQLGTQLSGVLYVLDEPSIGLHPKDHEKLLKSLKHLRDLGNSVLVVEHDEETMRAADHLIDVGPGAGAHGGKIVWQGTLTGDACAENSATLEYLSGRRQVCGQRTRRRGNGHEIFIGGCTGHNLANISLKLPLGKLVVVTGVSGSGKSSLIRDTLEAALSKKLYRTLAEPLPYKELQGLDHIDKLVHIDQQPIGRSPRSNPATYTGLFALLRGVYAQSPEAQIRGYTPGTFSFNVKGGRCDACEGAGRIKLEMHFLPEVYVPCEVCLGTRYRREVQEVRFKGKNIAEVLAMNVEAAYEHFKNQPLIEPKLRTLLDVGLGYIHLGQAATTLSGGEAQRIKLARELSKRSTGRTIYFLDEPTTGLHFEDVKKLLDLLQLLCDKGNTVVVIEHHLDVICSADWVIDLGPGAGREGGEIVFQGTPEAFVRDAASTPTGTFLKSYFSRHAWTV